MGSSVEKEFKRIGSDLISPTRAITREGKKQVKKALTPPEIEIPEPPPKIDREGEFAAESQRKRRRRARGRASTILTKGSQVGANIGTTTLLGG